MSLMPQLNDYARSQELQVISNIIDADPIICERVLQDLNTGKLLPIDKVPKARGPIRCCAALL